MAAVSRPESSWSGVVAKVRAVDGSANIPCPASLTFSAHHFEMVLPSYYCEYFICRIRLRAESEDPGWLAIHSRDGMDEVMRCLCASFCGGMMAPAPGPREAPSVTGWFGMALGALNGVTLSAGLPTRLAKSVPPGRPGAWAIGAPCSSCLYALPSPESGLGRSRAGWSVRLLNLPGPDTGMAMAYSCPARGAL